MNMFLHKVGKFHLVFTSQKKILFEANEPYLTSIQQVYSRADFVLLCERGLFSVSVHDLC